MKVVRLESTNGGGCEPCETIYATFDDGSMIEIAWRTDGQLQVIGFDKVKGIDRRAVTLTKEEDDEGVYLIAMGDRL